ncbi:MAG: hypothetical protein J6T44_07270 [Prevotella sp.]|jgi:hypothetical protein|nr:hypothetical protein [Prevotella sp.]MBO7539067.1 hypothetical protein [Prevotella sp.]
MLVNPRNKKNKVKEIGSGRGILSPLTSHLLPLIGVALVMAGALFLIIAFLAAWTSNNLVLLLGLFVIFIGLILHVKYAKSGEKY